MAGAGEGVAICGYWWCECQRCGEALSASEGLAGFEKMTIINPPTLTSEVAKHILGLLLIIYLNGSASVTR